MRYFLVCLVEDIYNDEKYIKNTEIYWSEEINSIEVIREIEKYISNHHEKITILNYKKLFDE